MFPQSLLFFFVPVAGPNIQGGIWGKCPGPLHLLKGASLKKHWENLGEIWKEKIFTKGATEGP